MGESRRGKHADISRDVGPDYGAFPLWNLSPASLRGALEAQSLPVTAELAQELDEWNIEWETIDAGDDALLAEWELRGRTLVGKLQRELGPSVTVWFYLDDAETPAFDTKAFVEAHRVEPADPGAESTGHFSLDDD